MEWIAISVVFGLGIVLASTVQIVRMAIAHEEKRLGLQAGQADIVRLEQIIVANQTEMAKLRDRVNVLEKLATDDDRRLATDIERLRADELRR